MIIKAAVRLRVCVSQSKITGTSGWTISLGGRPSLASAGRTVDNTNI